MKTAYLYTVHNVDSNKQINTLICVNNIELYIATDKQVLGVCFFIKTAICIESAEAFVTFVCKVWWAHIFQKTHEPNFFLLESKSTWKKNSEKVSEWESERGLAKMVLAYAYDIMFDCVVLNFYVHILKVFGERWTNSSEDSTRFDLSRFIFQASLYSRRKKTHYLTHKKRHERYFSHEVQTDKICTNQPIVKLSFHIRSNLWMHLKCVPLTDMITPALASWHFSVFIYTKKDTKAFSPLHREEKADKSSRCKYNYSSSTPIFTEVFRIKRPMSTLRYLKKYQIPYEILWSARSTHIHTSKGIIVSWNITLAFAPWECLKWGAIWSNVRERDKISISVTVYISVKWITFQATAIKYRRRNKICK